MKIRTDFVTNSSSSSFISIVVNTKDGKAYSGGYHSGDNSMIYDGDFNPNKKYFESLEDCGQLIKEMKEWFAGTFANSSLPEEFDYSEGDLDEIAKIKIENVKSIVISSMVDYEETGFGSDITYNYETKKRTKKDTSYGEDF